VGSAAEDLRATRGAVEGGGRDRHPRLVIKIS
jgi:hypothetical protein